MSGDDDGGNPPPADGYAALINGTWSLPPSTEKCTSASGSPPRPIRYIQAIRPVAPVGTHHTVLMLGPPDGSGRHHRLHELAHEARDLRVRRRHAARWSSPPAWPCTSSPVSSSCSTCTSSTPPTARSPALPASRSSRWSPRVRAARGRRGADRQAPPASRCRRTCPSRPAAAPPPQGVTLFGARAAHAHAWHPYEGELRERGRRGGARSLLDQPYSFDEQRFTCSRSRSSRAPACCSRSARTSTRAARAVLFFEQHPGRCATCVCVRLSGADRRAVPAGERRRYSGGGDPRQRVRRPWRVIATGGGVVVAVMQPFSPCLGRRTLHARRRSPRAPRTGIIPRGGRPCTAAASPRSSSDRKSADGDTAATFWSQALGRPVTRPIPTTPTTASFHRAADSEPQVLVQRVDHDSRIHLDIESASNCCRASASSLRQKHFNARNPLEAPD